jgi:hypothetical protein
MFKLIPRSSAKFSWNGMNCLRPRTFNLNIFKCFTGKTETGWKFTTPLMKMKSVNPIFPPPGEKLEIPRIFLY